jgi:hypothetical protein
MTEAPWIGYPAQVWATCWQALNWLAPKLSGTVNLTDDPSLNVFRTLLHGVHAIDAWQTAAVLSNETLNMTTIEALNLNLDSTTQAYFTTRIGGINSAAAGIAALVPPANPFTAISLLNQGEPAIADPGFIEWGMNFAGESPPLGADLNSGADAMSLAWLAVTNAILTLQGDNLTTAYDTAARQYRCCAVIGNDIDTLQSGPFNAATTMTTGDQLTDSAGNPLFDSSGAPLFATGLAINSYSWSQIIGLPVILLDAASLSSSPATLEAQQSMVIRNLLLVQMNNLANLLLALRQHNVVQPIIAELRNAESLADLANRTTSNFENWTAIAALNSLQPPYPGPTNQAIALSGRQLFVTNGLVAPGVLPDPDDKHATYANNVLGTDWDWGPINGSQPVWNGDISLITGYYNFARSIGRRLQTPLGALIYHFTYGCRIPPEVGAIQSIDEASRLNQYGRSAIFADPRTGQILQSQATTQPGFLATFSATIAPVGPNTSSSVVVNETIGPGSVTG